MPRAQTSKESHSKKRRWHIVQSLFFIFVFSLAIFFFFQSPVFSVKEVTVSGNRQLKADDVVSLTGLVEGVNIFKANLQQARDKVALHPMVQSVNITRHFPDTIVINLTERKPVGLQQTGGGFAVISEDGFCLSLVKNLDRINLPFINGGVPLQVMPGQKITDQKTASALSYLLAMPLNIRGAVSEINVADLNNIRMFTLDKVEVKFGDETTPAEKIKLYQEVISQKYQDKIQYIDISYKGPPVIKCVQSPEQENKQP